MNRNISVGHQTPTVNWPPGKVYTPILTGVVNSKPTPMRRRLHKNGVTNLFQKNNNSFVCFCPVHNTPHHKHT